MSLLVTFEGVSLLFGPIPWWFSHDAFHSGGQACHRGWPDRDWKVRVLVVPVLACFRSWIASIGLNTQIWHGILTVLLLQVVVAEGCSRIHHPNLHQFLSSELRTRRLLQTSPLMENPGIVVGEIPRKALCTFHGCRTHRN